MVVFPNSKINLGLHILRKRPDGYHDLETVFYPIPYPDILEVVANDTNSFHSYGLPVPGDPSANLCVKAWHLLKKDFPGLPNVAIHLYKHIPMGAGLGGGSADAAFMLKIINEQYRLGLSNDKLAVYALELGSDCPFFIVNQPCLATGRGEITTPNAVNLSGYSIVIVHTGIHINTALAFSQLTPSNPSISVAEIVSRPLAIWKHDLQNDFEGPAFRQYPILANIKDILYNAGAIYASMTGSGSSFYGIFEKNNIPSFSFEQNFKVVILK